ncbi:hypothetical protein OHA79_52105 (plasmid) [Streptomyces sp. NBC_00841]|uniref:hypothetical protein n=1 Tax=Streptomyces sp. NBC_00841 TaxID=2975847 RepID=UPI002DDAEB9A|nr:hypothetical protein [Streptomyces sp. NBC_00841]WSA06026.1 hypothetical protein OHA79_52105 [Streptomyces sp. NBC_00841]
MRRTRGCAVSYSVNSVEESSEQATTMFGIAWRKPSLFLNDCIGFEQLVETVVEPPELTAAAKDPNARLGKLA